MGLAILLAVAAYTRGTYYKALLTSDLGPELTVSGANFFGTSCEYSVGTFDTTPETILKRPHAFKAQPNCSYYYRRSNHWGNDIPS